MRVTYSTSSGRASSSASTSRPSRRASRTGALRLRLRGHLRVREADGPAAETVHRGLKREPRPRRGLEEERAEDLPREPRADVALEERRGVEQREDVVLAEIVGGDHVPAAES